MAGPYTFGTDTREPLYLVGTKGDGTVLGGLSGAIADLHARLEVAEREGLAPADHGYLGWAYPPLLAAGSSALTTGIPVVSKVRVPKYAAGVTFQNIDYWVATAGVTLTAGTNWVAVYSSAGVLLGSVGQDTNFTILGKQTATFGAPVALADPNGYVLVFAVSAGTTPVALGRTASALSATIVNVNLAAAASRAATTTSAATPPSTLTTLTGAASQQWFGLR